MRRTYRSIVAGMLLFAPLSARAGEANLDPSFGTFGFVTTNVNAEDDFAAAIVRQTDGKLIAAGGAKRGSTYHFTVIRYDAAGALDTGYGSGGIADVDFSSNAIPQHAVLQPDGKLIVAGFIFGNLGTPDDKIAIARLDASGALDPSFGTGGRVVTDLTPSYDSADAIALQSDGKLVVGSSSYSGSPGEPHFNLLRYLPDGSLDTSFGSGGHVTTVIGGFDVIGDVVIQPDTKIVAVGTSSGPPAQHAVAVRYLANGVRDAAFGTAGIVHTSFVPAFTFANAAVLQPDGDIVLAGSTATQDFAIARLTAAGSVDGAFGIGGVRYTDLGGNDIPTDMVRRPDGRLVVAGEVVRAVDPDPDIDIGLATYTPNGSPDGSFGIGGKITLSVGPGVDDVLGLALQPDGKLVGAGETSDVAGVDTRFLLARFGSACGNGVLDPGEQCDDGNAVSNDCCSSACQYESAGTRCDVDADACTADVCDGAGGCTAGGPVVCGVCEQCDTVNGCVPAPPAAVCKQTSTGASKLTVKRSGTTGRAVVGWQWTRGADTALAELGDPTTSTDYGLCLYGTVLGPLYLSIDAPAGGLCRGRPCWRSGARGFTYSDPDLTPDGVLKTALLAGPTGHAKAALKGKNVILHFPTYYSLAAMGLPLRAQLRARNGLCLEATYSHPRTDVNKLSASSD